MIHRRDTAGFTLVEIMVALAILSMILLATVSAFRTLVDTQTRLDGLTGVLEEQRLLGRFLRETIGQAQPLPREAGDGAQKSTYFHGTSRELIWLAPLLTGSTQASGLHILRLHQNDQRQLLLQFYPYRNPRHMPDWQQVPPHILLKDLVDFELAYRDQEMVWQGEWDWSARSPTQVRLRLSGTERHWPEMIIALPDANLPRQQGDGFVIGGG